MSYCRWSSDDFQCDLYCYEHCDGGYMTHVAGNRLVLTTPLPKPQPFTPENMKAWYRRHKRVERMLKKCKRVPIGGPHDGKSFWDETPQALLDRMLYLKQCGYRVPDYAINTIREEIADDDRGAEAGPEGGGACRS